MTFEQLTPDQEALIPVYKDKWRKIANSTERIDRQKVTDAVQAAYVEIGEKEPEIIFFDNPYQALKGIFTDLREQLKRNLGEHLLNKLGCDTYYQSRFGLPNDFESVYWALIHRLEDGLGVRLNQYEHEINRYSVAPIIPQVWADEATWRDFCISEGKYDFGFLKQESLFLSLIKLCGWIFPFERICLVCDRPLKLSFDPQNRLHAEGEPAVQFIDGYSLYCYHGVTLPEKYEKLYPHQWSTRWLLEETEPDLRRVLIEGIGYDKIYQELELTEIDVWQGYVLLKVRSLGDSEPVCLLTVTTPDTKFIQAEKIPPDIRSAREASYLVGWESNPEESGVEFWVSDEITEKRDTL